MARTGHLTFSHQPLLPVKKMIILPILVAIYCLRIFIFVAYYKAYYGVIVIFLLVYVICVPTPFDFTITISFKRQISI